MCGAYAESHHLSGAPLTCTSDVLTRCNRSIFVVSIKVWVDHMRRSYDPYVYVACEICNERWWYNPYSSGEDGKKVCRNNPNHEIKMVSALGGRFNNPRPKEAHKQSTRSGHGAAGKNPTAFYHPPKPILSDEERYRRKIDSREQRKKQIGKEKTYRQKLGSHKKTRRNRSSIPPGLRWDVLERDQHKCVYCGRKADPENGVVLHVDHRVPRSKGGKDTKANLFTACEECNLGKSDKRTRWRPS